jgi:hypothetical protein
MPGFDDAWTAVASGRDGDSVSPQLRPLLRQVYADVLTQPLSMPCAKFFHIAVTLDAIFWPL